MALTPPKISLSPLSLTGTFKNRHKNNSPIPWQVHYVNTTAGDYLDQTRWTLAVSVVDFAHEAKLILNPGSAEEEKLLQDGQTLILTLAYSNGLTDELSVKLAAS